jgi:hypothetical protein
MPKYLVYVPFTFDSVFKIEADSPEESKKKYNTGEFNYDENYLYDTDVSDVSDTLGEITIEEVDDNE